MLRVLIQVLRIYLSGFSIVSIIPLLKSNRPDVSRVPSKAFRLTGFISLAFSIALVLPLIIEQWGIDLGISESLLYLGFYGLLNIRFLVILIPKLVKRAADKELKREANMDRFGITPREREIYDLLGKGYTYKDMARLLHISLPTVKTHMDHLYKKTGTRNKVELINEIEAV
jgi:DNA-binding CsgD family transcriptional regulator